MQIDFSRQPSDALPLAEYERIRAQGPVTWSDSLGAWVISPYEEVKTVLSDLVHFTSEGTPISEAFGKEGMLVNDTPLHHRMRAIWAAQVSKPALASRDERLQQIAAGLLEPVEARLKAGETVDLIETFEAFVTEVLTWMFGTPPDGRADIKRWHRMFSETPALAIAKDSPAYARHVSARAEVHDFLDRQMNDRRRRMASGELPGDLISLMVAAEGQDGITPVNATDNIMNFFTGAMNTTAKWMGNVFAVLHRHSDALEEVRANRGLLPQTIEEVMRFETVAQVLIRLVKQDTELGGKALKARDSVFIFPGIANRDSEVFDDAGIFDIHRVPRTHLGFGFGVHHCLGVNIARQEIISFTNAMLDMFPGLDIGSCEYGSSWALWGPHSLQIRLPSGRQRALPNRD